MGFISLHFIISTLSVYTLSFLVVTDMLSSNILINSHSQKYLKHFASYNEMTGEEVNDALK